MSASLRSAIAVVVAAIALLGGPASAQETVLFSDDFEHGAAKWDLQGGWQVALDGANHVLASSGGGSARPVGGDRLGTVESLELRLRLDQGRAVIFLRESSWGAYTLSVYPNGVTLSKSTRKVPAPPTGDQFDWVDLCHTGAPVTLGQWLAVRLTWQASRLTVLLDAQEVLACTDSSDPHLFGNVAVTPTSGSQVAIDDVTIRGVKPPALAWAFTGGPRGGIGYDIRFDPRSSQVIWVTDAYAGAHQSTDGGQTWVARNDGITARSGPSGDAVPIFCLTIDHHNPDTLWAGTFGMKGIFKSLDGGGWWTEMDAGVESRPTMEMRSFTVDPHDPNVVYCGGNYMAEPATLKHRGFIYKTTDGGASWRLLTEPGALVRWIIVDPTDSNVIYAATGIWDRFAVKPEGILKSLDGGVTWRSINQGLTSLCVGALAMHPTNPQVLIAGTGQAGSFANEGDQIFGGVYKTTDGGEHWRQVDPVHADHEIRFSAVAFAPSNPDIVYADAQRPFLRSADGGETWQVITPDTQAENRGATIALAVHPSDPDTIYMNAYGGGVFLSTDGGTSWSDASKGYTGSQVWSIAIDPRDTERLLIGSKNGVHLSEDGGATWSGRNTDGRVLHVGAIAFDPADAQTLLLGGKANGGWIGRTVDGGAHWEVVLPTLGDNTLAGSRWVSAVVFSPTSPRVVLAATSIDPGYVSHDVVGPGVFRSTDGGVTWVPANAGLEGTTRNVMSLAVQPTDGTVAYIGLLGKGVFTSTDGATTWSPANSGIASLDVRALAVDPRHPATVFAGAEQAGLWRSMDSGGTWKPCYGLPMEASVRAILVDPLRAGVVWAADQQSGVYRSADGGTTWGSVNTGLHNRAVNALALTADGLHLYAATEGNGVYRLDLPQPRVVRRHLGRR